MYFQYEDNLETLYATKLYVKLGKGTTETYEMLQIAYGSTYMR